MSDFVTLAAPAEIEISIKHSTFIAVARPVATEEEAVALIEEQRVKHPTANHHVYAYRLREGNRTRYSDDGEPAKTAGLPVLAMLEGRGVIDAAVVVIRYFGGTLLGTGGLVRAYGDSAKFAIEAAGIRQRVMSDVIKVTVEYSMYEKMCHIITTVGGETTNCIYADNIEITAVMPCNVTEHFLQEVKRIGNGKIIPLPTDKIFT